jgi:hypothetical protein
MLRRIPATLLVCIAIFVAAFAVGTAGARTPEESVDILLKPNLAAGRASEDGAGVRTRQRAQPKTSYAPVRPIFQFPQGLHRPIIKVRPEIACAPVTCTGYGCFLPKPAKGQWELGFQTFFARVKGTLQSPRADNSWYYGYYYNYYTPPDFTDQLNLPANRVLLQFTARYQFRPTWAIRYSIMGDNISGSGYPQSDFILANNWGYAYGVTVFSASQTITSKWQHRYQRLGLVYDPIKTPSAVVSVFADWVHTDDSLQISSPYCTYNCFNKSQTGDPAMVGLEVQRCTSTAANGATLSCEGKAGLMFLDDSSGWDVQAGCRYSLPMGYNRWGYIKGGYRNVTINKGTAQYVFNHSFEGGFMEFGFIF